VAAIPAASADSRPVSRKPAWVTDEYASIRFTSICVTASTAPTTMVAMATAASTGRQSSTNPGAATYSTRASAPTAAILVAAAMNAVTGVGAPWYTSGTHAWNGTAPILNNSPTASIANP